MLLLMRDAGIVGAMTLSDPSIFALLGFCGLRQLLYFARWFFVLAPLTMILFASGGAGPRYRILLL